VVRLLIAALVGLSVSLTGFATIAAEATPEALPATPSKMPAYLAGNAYELIPQGKPNTLDDVIVGPLLDTAMPIVIRNNTKGALSDIEASAVASDKSGSRLAAGNAPTIYPNVLEPGDISLASIYFEQPDKLSGATFHVTAKGNELDPDYSSNIIELNFTEVALQANHLVGIVRNDDNDSVEIPAVYGQCFDEAGAIIGFFDGFVSSDIGPDDEATFDISLSGTASCDRFLVVPAAQSSGS